MNLTPNRYALAASALALSLQGCAMGKDEPAGFNVRAAPTVTSQLSARDALYASAASAINRGDYAYALDLLQAARDRGGEDARILNAFGVIYDKLGRFDLSQRYYTAAKALDPTSQIVAQNLAYSQMLQGRSAPIALAAAEAAPAPQPAKAPALAPQPPAPAVVTPVAVATLASQPQLARTELRKAGVGGALRTTPTLNAPAETASPATPAPAAAAVKPAVVAHAATPWDAAAVRHPMPAPLARAAAPHGAPLRAVEPSLASPTAKPTTPKAQARQAAPGAPVKSAASGAPAQRRPQQLAAKAPAAPAVRTASISRPAAPRAAPTPAPRGWTLAAAHEQVARMLSRGLRFFEDLDRCRTGCSKVAVPLNAKPTLRVTARRPAVRLT